MTTATKPTLPASTFTPAPYTGPSKADVLAARREFLTPALLTYYNDPIMIVQGHMQWLFDEKGTRYLDAFAGIVTVSVGHCHPRVLEAVREQNEKIQHTTTIYLHPNVAEFGRKLASCFPANSNLKVTYFVNSGSEANDLAIMMARGYTGAFDVIALRNAYHGTSPTSLGLTALHTWKYNVPHSWGIHHAILPDRFRGPFGYDDPDAGPKYARDVLDLIKASTSGKVAAFIAEPIQGVGGTVELPPGYLEHVYTYIRAHGGLCISDEVQTGFGRTGTNFWGFQNQNVAPDIVTMAKGMGNGAPLAAVTTTPDIAGALAERLHFNTYGGNPVSSAQGLATLNVILEENIQAHALEVGNYLKEGLKDVQSRHPIFADVRGQGLMIGVELAHDDEEKTPASAECNELFNRAKDMGLLIGKGGLAGNSLRIKPPMCIQKEDCEFLCRVLDVALTDMGL